MFPSFVSSDELSFVPPLGGLPSICSDFIVADILSSFAGFDGTSSMDGPDGASSVDRPDGTPFVVGSDGTSSMDGFWSLFTEWVTGGVPTKVTISKNENLERKDKDKIENHKEHTKNLNG